MLGIEITSLGKFLTNKMANENAIFHCFVFFFSVRKDEAKAKAELAEKDRKIALAVSERFFWFLKSPH